MGACALAERGLSPGWVGGWFSVAGCRAMLACMLSTTKIGYLMKVIISNTLTRTKEVFEPINSGKVSLYVCGITPYSYSHIGHARVYIVFDVLVRVLRLSGLEVTYIRNFTDIEDKILDRIEGDHADIVPKIKAFVDPFIADYHAGLAALNCQPPTFEPRVTETMPEIIDLVDRLLKNGHAYHLGNSIYYDIASFPSYGRLSGHPLENLIAGSRIDLNDQKRNPGDFALWKGNDQGLYWESPWGFGRPGWHIECSAMVHKYVEHLDIHGGGADLMFPHHENERAQSEAGYCSQLSKYWMHVEFLNLNKEKMSKSLGNVMLMRDVVTQANPMAFRLLMLQHGHTKPLNYSQEDLEAAAKAFDRLNDVFWKVELLDVAELVEAVTASEVDFIEDAVLGVASDDLNAAKAIALVFENMSDIKADKRTRQLAKALLCHVLGFVFAEPKQQEIPAEIQKIIDEREQARASRDWATSDRLRDQLAGLGYVVQDKKK